MAKADENYNKDWYEANKDRISEERKQKYAEDPDYAEEQRRRARERYHQQKAAGVPRKRNRKKADPTKSKGKRQAAVWTREFTIVVNGARRTEVVHTIGYLADQLSRSIQGLRLWESSGTLPPPLFRDSANRRLYTSHQVQKIVALHDEFFGPDAPKLRRIKDSEFEKRLHQIWTDMPQGVPVH